MNNDYKWRGFRLNESQAKREIRRATQRDGRRRARKGLLIVLCLAVGFGMLLKWAALDLAVLHGDGMRDTLRGGDVVLCLHSLPLPGSDTVHPRRGELVLAQVVVDGVRRRVVRRVIATAGDEVFVTLEGKVTVNGEPLDEPYATYRVADPEESAGSGLIPNPFALDLDEPVRVERDERWNEVSFPVTVPEGQLFVLADDRNTFDDGRSAAFGMVKEDNLLGLPAAIVWPAHRIGLLRAFQGDKHIWEMNPLPGLLATPAPHADDGSVLD